MPDYGKIFEEARQKKQTEHGNFSDYTVDDIEIQKLMIHNEMTKWLVHQAKLTAAVSLLAVAFLLLLHIGERAIAVDLLKITAGAIAGFGVASSCVEKHKT